MVVAPLKAENSLRFRLSGIADEMVVIKLSVPGIEAPRCLIVVSRKK